MTKLFHSFPHSSPSTSHPSLFSSGALYCINVCQEKKKLKPWLCVLNVPRLWFCWSFWEMGFWCGQPLLRWRISSLEGVMGIALPRQADKEERSLCLGVAGQKIHLLSDQDSQSWCVDWLCFVLLVPFLLKHCFVPRGTGIRRTKCTMHLAPTWLLRPGERAHLFAGGTPANLMGLQFFFVDRIVVTQSVQWLGPLFVMFNGVGWGSK